MEVKQLIINFYAEKREEWLEDCREIARRELLKRDYVTTQDIKKLCPVPKDVNPSAVGHIFRNQPDFKLFSPVPIRSKTELSGNHFIYRWTLTKEARASLEARS